MEELKIVRLNRNFNTFYLFFYYILNKQEWSNTADMKMIQGSKDHSTFWVTPLGCWLKSSLLLYKINQKPLREEVSEVIYLSKDPSQMAGIPNQLDLGRRFNLNGIR